jgi:hypothetical protein
MRNRLRRVLERLRAAVRPPSAHAGRRSQSSRHRRATINATAAAIRSRPRVRSRAARCAGRMTGDSSRMLVRSADERPPREEASARPPAVCGTGDGAPAARGRRRVCRGHVSCLRLLGRRLTDSSWPLAHAPMFLVGPAALCYFASLVLRARGWRRLFPGDECPDQGTLPGLCRGRGSERHRAAVSARLLLKIGMLRRLGGIRISLEAIALSIVSLGMVDAIAMLPLSISATATSSADLRGPLLVVVAFGVGCCILLLASGRLVRLPLSVGVDT